MTRLTEDQLSDPKGDLNVLSPDGISVVGVSFIDAGAGVNGFHWAPGGPQGTINFKEFFKIDWKSGTVSPPDGVHDAYPSYGVYSYTVGPDGKSSVTKLEQFSEKQITDLGKKGVQVGAGIVGKPPAPKDMTRQTGKRLNPNFTDPSQDWAPATEQ